MNGRKQLDWPICCFWHLFENQQPYCKSPRYLCTNLTQKKWSMRCILTCTWVLPGGRTYHIIIWITEIHLSYVCMGFFCSSFSLFLSARMGSRQHGLTLFENQNQIKNTSIPILPIDIFTFASKSWWPLLLCLSVLPNTRVHCAMSKVAHLV